MFRLLLIAALIFIVVRFVQRHLAASKQPPPGVRPAPPDSSPRFPSPRVDYSHARDADFREVHSERREPKKEE
ncbi:MAG: hypothetical protein IT211_06675 [Armatimonadetes bacterium]|nr:hypothetical protein [Armatimonadota bacterium]